MYHIQNLLIYEVFNFCFARSDSLHVGDRLIAINGYQIGTLTHEEILSLLRKLKDHLELTIEYNLNDLCAINFLIVGIKFFFLNSCIKGFQKSPKPTIIKSLEVKLERETFGVGLTLRGGVCPYDHKKTRPLTIYSIRIGGSADR